jgi:hypothetical protein
MRGFAPRANVWGCSLARQRDTELSLREGDALFWTRSLAGIGSMRFTPAGFLGCRVARAEVEALLGRLDEAPMCFIPRDTEALQLLITYAKGTAESVQLATPELQRLASATYMILWRRSSPPHAVAGRLPRGAA